METKKYRSRIKAWAIFFWCIDTSIADTLTAIFKLNEQPKKKHWKQDTAQTGRTSAELVETTPWVEKTTPGLVKTSPALVRTIRRWVKGNKRMRAAERWNAKESKHPYPSFPSSDAFTIVNALLYTYLNLPKKCSPLHMMLKSPEIQRFSVWMVGVFKPSHRLPSIHTGFLAKSLQINIVYHLSDIEITNCRDAG